MSARSHGRGGKAVEVEVGEVEARVGVRATSGGAGGGGREIRA